MTTDNVNHPDHYFAPNGLEALDVIEAFFHGNYFLGNVFKYTARAGKKDPDKELEDLRKAEFYLKREIVRLQRHLGPLADRKKELLADWEEELLGEIVWHKDLTDIPCGVTAWDKESWEAGRSYDIWYGEGPYGGSYEECGPFTTTPPVPA